MVTSSSDDISPEKVEEEFNKLLANASWIAILTALRMYHSLSTPEISRLVNIKKTTVFNHINQLEESGYIEVDEDRSAQEFIDKGSRARKYYMLSKLAKQIFNTRSEQYDEDTEIEDYLDVIMNQSEEERLDQLIDTLKEQIKTDTMNYVKLLSQMNTTIEQITMEEIQQIINKVTEQDDRKVIREVLKDSVISPYSSINYMATTIELYSKEQALEFINLYSTFQKDFHQLKRKFDNSEEKHQPTIKPVLQYLYQFMAPTKNMLFDQPDSED